MSSGRPEGPDPDGIGKKWREQCRESVCDDILAVRDFREIGAQKCPLLQGKTFMFEEEQTWRWQGR